MENQNTPQGLQSTWNPTWYSSASEAEQAEFRDWFRGLLVSERVNVRFTKADGTDRLMHCTLHPELVPVTEVKEGSKPRSQEAQSVWDIDAGAWRSFRWDRMQEFSFSLGDLHV